MRNVSSMKKPLLNIMAVMLIVPIFLVFSVHLILCQGLAETFKWFWNMPLIALFELMMIYIPTMLLYSIYSRLWVCGTVIGIPYIFLTLVSYFKFTINGTPLLISDFRMISQFFEVAAFAMPQVSFSVYTWCGSIPIILLVVLAMVDHYKRETRLKIYLALFSTIAIGLFLFSPIFSECAVRIDDEDKFQEQRVAEYGPVMGMYCTYAQAKKSGQVYNNDAVDRVTSQLEKSVQKNKGEVTPTVIFFMSESFFDVAKLENVTFKTDPLPNFHRIAKGYQSGEFISSAYCGGTGYVEMEVLTGLCSNLLKAGDTITYLSEKDVYRRIPAISDVFKNYGYKTVYLHSYNNELYNREEIYSQFGFDKILFEDDFEEPEYRGGYISDASLADKIISVYEENGEDKLFLYAVSMENHQPYNGDKFPKALVKSTTDKLNDEEMDVLDTYITGVYDADKALGKLIRYFGKKTEPVMLVFFGDHLPNLILEDKNNVFTKLGYIDGADSTEWDSAELKKMLSTDYVIWTNYDDENYKDVTMSSSFLGVSVIERLGMDMTDYYRWLSDRVMPKLLMYRSRLFVDKQGVATTKVPELYQGVTDDYAVAVYDIVYGNNKIFGLEREVNALEQKEK